jgi:hypothetical protein
MRQIRELFTLSFLLLLVACSKLNNVTAILNAGSGAVAFGDVKLNTPATQSLVLSSSGTVPVTINNIAITGTGFSMASVTTPLTIQPGQTQTLSIQFDPTSAGAATGQLTVSTKSTDSQTIVVALTGTGTAPSYSVDLTWDAPTSSPDPVAGYDVYRAAGSNGVYQLLNSIVNTGTTYMDASVMSGQAYTYYVESVDAQGNKSVPSNRTTTTIP